MSNVLKVSLQTTIYSLADRGWSQRWIARELGINRETVGRYLRLAEAKPAISPPSSEGASEAKPAILTAGPEGSSASKPAISTVGKSAGRKSQCEPLAEVILAKVEVGLSAQRIYQDLVEEKGVQRFLRVGEALCAQAASEAARANLPIGMSAWRRGAAGFRSWKHRSIRAKAKVGAVGCCAWC